jgi:hypothetical protein
MLNRARESHFKFKGKRKYNSKRYRRCPQCKKLRLRWMPTNWWYSSRIKWSKDLSDNDKAICHICQQRNPVFQVMNS